MQDKHMYFEAFYRIKAYFFFELIYEQVGVFCLFEMQSYQERYEHKVTRKIYQQK